MISIAGTTLNAPEDLPKALTDRKPGDEVELVFKRRGGQEVRAKTTLTEDPRLEVVPIEKSGGTLTDAQKRFRDAWLNSKVTK